MADPKKPGQYKFDVFVSYSRAPITRVWVKRYIIGPKDRKKRTGVTFVDWLEHHLGHEPRVFYDDHGLEVGDKWAKKILAALATSKCIVPIWSKPYFASRWCMAEWETFRLRAESTNHTLAVPIRLMDEEDLPESVQGFTVADFDEYNNPAPCYPDTVPFADFQVDLSDFAKRVKDLLGTISDFDPNWPIVHPGDAGGLTTDWDEWTPRTA